MRFDRLMDQLVGVFAVLVLVGGTLLVLAPIFYAGFAFFAHVPESAAFLRERFAAGLPPLPDWLAVLGGAAAFGFLGVFIGPTMLAAGPLPVEPGQRAMP